MRRISINTKSKILNLYRHGISPKYLSEEFKVNLKTIYDWIEKEKKHSLVNSSNSSSTKTISDIHKLTSSLEKTQAELQFLQRVLVEDLPLNYRIKLIDEEYGKESLHVQCEALEVKRSTYLNHKKRNKNNDSWYKQREARFANIIVDLYYQSKGVYGANKIAAIISQTYEPTTQEYVSRLMGKLGLKSVIGSSNKNYQHIQSYLRREQSFCDAQSVTDINQIWVSDTTAILINNTYYYVCVYIDLFSRLVLSWSISRNNSTQLTKRAFLRAYTARQPKCPLTLHTDNGKCYTSYSFNRILSKHNINHSYSRPYHPHDNAVAESFFKTLKREAIFLTGYPRSLYALTTIINDYIDRYNATRPHESLGYLSPKQYEEKKKEENNKNKKNDNMV